MRAGLAHALGIGVYAAATVAGLAVVLHRFPSLETGIRLAGSLFLLWLAWKSWRGAGAAPAERNVGAGRPARDGFLIAFLNPKVALFSWPCSASSSTPAWAPWRGCRWPPRRW